MTPPPETQEVWADLLVDALVASGVSDVVLSPGSRSTPLVLAFLRDGRVRVHDVVDERSAGFLALGMGRALGRPAVLVCTSGSAPTHYHPAVVEADAAAVPMLVLSANRPFALQRGGESQTIDQTKLFGDRVRFFADLGEPSARAGDLRSMRRVVAQALFATTHPVPGPAHLDARFVKPLEPTATATEAGADVRALGARLRSAPPPRFHAPETRASADAIRAVAHRIARARRPLVLVGPRDATRPPLGDALDAFARCTRIPVYVESGSGLRFGPGAERRLGAFDAVFRADEARRALAPDLVIQLGRAPVSTAYARLATEGEPALVAIDEHALLDPFGRASDVLFGASVAALEALTAELASATLACDVSFAETLTRLDAAAFECAAAFAEGTDDACTEAGVARALLSGLPPGALLQLGNSLSIRQVDAWVPPQPVPLVVHTQRGASGIDGLLAGFVGAQLAVPRPGALLLGDVSFAHDLGSLPLLRRLSAPSLVLVVDNDGGRIFEQLPIATTWPRAMPHFETPPGIDGVAVGRALGLAAHRVHTSGELRARITEALATPGPTLLVVSVPPHGAIEANRRLWSAVARAVGDEVGR